MQRIPGSSARGRFPWRAGLLLGLLAAGGCLPFLRPARVPLRTVELAAGGGDCLAVLLPGRFGGPRNFDRAGFAEAARQQGVAIDLIAVDAHLGYYRDRSVVSRLRDDVVRPARAAGYRRLWLVGASLGGVGALLYARDHPEDLTGVLTLAPFLGDKELIGEIRDAGGPLEWQPGEIAEGEDFRRLWSWLKRRADDPAAPQVHLGFGTADGFAEANRLFAELLPAQRVLTADGGHDWRVWRSLWQRFLADADPCAPG